MKDVGINWYQTSNKTCYIPQVRRGIQGGTGIPEDFMDYLLIRMRSLGNSNNLINKVHERFGAKLISN